MDKQKITILVLGIVLVFVLNYFLLSDFFEQNERQIAETFLTGRDQGIKETITKLFEDSENCSIVPIFMENSSKKIVDVDCLELDNSLKP